MPRRAGAVTPEPPHLPQFDRRFFGGEGTFTLVGDGELGGKATGLRVVQERILSRLEHGRFPRFAPVVPTLTVLTTDVFDAFMSRNGLYPVAFGDAPDDRIALAFQQAELPAEFVGDLRALIASVHTPLAVRSSSLLEDALAHPFAGVYQTKMIPNNQPSVDARFHRLVEAVKFVMASTFFAEPRSYIRSVGRTLQEEKMAVIVQEVVGTRRDDRFYPALSGVARSYNYYPSGRAGPGDGVVSLALGLGKQIVDGGVSWTYSPAYPKAPPPYSGVGDILRNSQTEFWAVNMGPPPPPDPIRETEYLLRADLGAAEWDGVLDQLVSTYDAGSERLRPGLHGEGPRVLDFAPILTMDTLPLNDLLVRLLELTKEALGSEVEIEFAASLGPGLEGSCRFGFLQARPMMVARDAVAVSEDDLQGEDVIVSSDRALGNGVRNDIRDVVYVRHETFEAKHTQTIATELADINRGLVEDGRPCLLVGFGRWGSSDPWLGIPVDWGQISAARAMVEATLPRMSPDMSQGSHFFHNLISFGVLYLSVRHSGDGRIRWDWLDRQPAIVETQFVRHVRLAEPLEIRVDGRSGRGVVKHGGEPAASA
jgi:hypothetical protein